MPRNNQGSYTLPTPQNPVVPNTLITTEWANPTMSDIADALTGSVSRDGAGSMSGQLTLPTALCSQPRHAAQKAYVDSFMAFATGMPLGAVFAMAPDITLPSGYLLCNGSVALIASYPDLAAALGTTYGPVTATTFTLPDLRDWFIRGKGVNRPVGSLQSDAIKGHIHPITDLAHAHSITQSAHNHTQNPHNHTATQPAHSHSVTGAATTSRTDASGTPNVATASATTTGTAQPDITVDLNTATNNGANANITVDPQFTGITTTQADSTSGETTPRNIAMNYWIKAVNDAGGGGGGTITGITSSDSAMIAISLTVPNVPNLLIQSNVAGGTVKLDATGKVPVNQLPATSQTFLGPFSASGGQNPSQAFPTQMFATGSTYIISAAGNILVFDPVTFVQSTQLASVGQNIVYVINTPTPSLTGWYLMVTSTTTTANNVSVVPVGGISATNVQAALQELDTEKLATTAINTTVMPYVAPGAIGNLLTSNGAIWTSASPGAGTGDVTGPAASTADAVAIFNGVTGKVIKDSAKLLPTGVIVGTTDSQTLTTKTINLANNIITGTTAQFNAALSDGDFATLSGTEVLTNKTINAANNTLTGTASALSIGGNAATATSAASATYSKQIPVTANAANMTAAMAGTCVNLTGGMTITNGIMAAGDAVSLYNDTAAPVTLTQGGSMVLRIGGVNTGANRTIAAYSMVTVWFKDNATAVVTGAVT